jgi:urea transport system ATP-binding protein
MIYRPTSEDTDRIEAKWRLKSAFLTNLIASPGSCRTGRSNGWKSACCWPRTRKLLLVDEPAAGMTLAEREHTTDLLRRAAETRAVVVVEHDMEFVRRLDCKVTVLHEGSVLAEGSLDHVTANKDVIDVYLGR